ncbi:K(+) efflux antiporter 6 [Citrus sinensis]|uniref:K(+) efflux antiporter 6 n=1 Tax=Citrus sinensis TaxID=2711 RepID=A0ACB8NTD3_CITSI|nr:K(+) efflux antiporter 6 [Citrus sinensis]
MLYILFLELLSCFVDLVQFINFASTNSVTKLDSKISATATATTTELNNTGSKEGSFANMIDRALEKKFNKSEQNEGLTYLLNIPISSKCCKRRLISDLVVLIVSATCGGIAFVCSGQPVIIGYLLVGSVIGPRGFSFVSEMVLVETVAQFGVIFLPFALGLEFSMAKVFFCHSKRPSADFPIYVLVWNNSIRFISKTKSTNDLL